jgi:hypothetical protein
MIGGDSNKAQRIVACVQGGTVSAGGEKNRWYLVAW